MSFCDPLISLGTVSSGLSHVVACRVFTAYYGWIYSVVRIDHILFTHSPGDGHLGCFHLLASVNSVALNMGVQMSVQVSAFNTFEYS